LQYEGLLGTSSRHVSFTVDSGQKRFCVGEHQILCVPSKCFIGNSHYMRAKDKIFHSFTSVFDYSRSVAAMAKAIGMPEDDFCKMLEHDNLFKPGALVSPRLGYFYPQHSTVPESYSPSEPHPYGLLLGRTIGQSDYFRREFYRVRFGATTYERVHPLEMEIINEI
jgi:hypothetical protein